MLGFPLFPVPESARKGGLTEVKTLIRDGVPGQGAPSP
jgi:hypothetical protein